MNICYLLLKPFLGKKGLAKFWEKVHLASLLGMGCGEASDDNKKSSGEYICFEYLKKNINKDKFIIFDIGANKGQYATEALKCLGEKAFIHSFEPSPKTFLELSENMSKINNIKINNFGISDVKTKANLYSTEDNSGLSSLYKRDLTQFGIELDNIEQIELDTIDNYCKDNSIAQIDLLKMDIEGNEFKALQGARETLKNKVKTIQIEFGGANVDSRTYFRDYWNLLSKEYRVYRIMKNGLFEIKKYKETLEIFYCTNYFFVKK